MNAGSRRGSIFSDSPEAAVERFHNALKAKYGTLRKAFKALDRRGSGQLSFEHLIRGVEDVGLMGIACDESSLQLVFNEFDVEDVGSITFSEFLGMKTDAPFEDSDEWQYLTTMEKWTRWCNMTKAHSAGFRAPTWQADGEASAARVTMQEKRDRDREAMRRMIAQGVHKQRSGLQLCAKHLPRDLDESSVQKFRREALDQVDKKSKSIKKVLSECSKNRQELKGMAEAFSGFTDAEVTGPQKELKEMFRMHRLPTRRRSVYDTTSVLSVETVNQFTEEALNAEEREARELARKIGMPIPDVEAIQAQFKLFGATNSGVAFDDFPNMLRSLIGDQRPELKNPVHLKSLWRTIDTDGDGRVSLLEYLNWHHNTCVAPRLSAGSYSK